MNRRLFTGNFTLLVLGQVFSLFGNYILRLALSMYLLDLTGSAAVFAGMLSMAILPTILLSPVGGVLADRLDRRWMMVALDALTGLFVLGAALLLARGDGLAVPGGLLLALSVLGAFETPVVQACIPSILAGDNITRGNAVVNQAASLSGLVAPALGGVLYAVFGLVPVMLASAACFFLTALLERFIRLEQRPGGAFPGGSTVKEDISASLGFLTREEPDILKMLLLAALSRFFVMGCAVIGMPYILRTLLGLDARYYGAAESALGVAAVLGSLAAGLLTGRLKTARLSLLLGSAGLFLLPAGAAFRFPSPVMLRYGAVVAAFCGMQLVISLFSIFAVSLIQQRTPDCYIGKVMAYTSAITLCAQPAGQLLYGFWLDRAGDGVCWVLFLTGAAVCASGLLSGGVFRRLGEGEKKIFEESAKNY